MRLDWQRPDRVRCSGSGHWRWAVLPRPALFDLGTSRRRLQPIDRPKFGGRLIAHDALSPVPARTAPAHASAAADLVLPIGLGSQIVLLWLAGFAIRLCYGNAATKLACEMNKLATAAGVTISLRAGSLAACVSFSINLSSRIKEGSVWRPPRLHSRKALAFVMLYAKPSTRASVVLVTHSSAEKKESTMIKFKFTLILAGLALIGGSSVALAASSGHFSINTLKTQQYAQRHHMNPASVAIRDPIGDRGVRERRHAGWYAHN